MTASTFETVKYETQDRQASWQGIGLAEGDAFNYFMSNDVASRLHDEDGNNEFVTHMRSLVTTGFAQDSLNEILAAEILEERDWAIGEAIAEAFLTRQHNIIWPWNMERDKRVPFASLPGADLIGFKINGEDIRLVLGEVKASSDVDTPPNVMYGRSGMVHQIDNLVRDLSVICQLLKWLLPRCKRTGHEASFNAAISLLLHSGNKAIAFFGVLLRDTKPKEFDLKARGQTIADNLQAPTTCQLIALYLPCAITDLPTRISGGKSS